MKLPVERYPDQLRKILADITCTKCGAKQGGGLAAVVFYQPPMYVIDCTCLKCATKGNVTFMGPAPAAAPVPAIEDVEKPKWYAHVESGKELLP